MGLHDEYGQVVDARIPRSAKTTRADAAGATPEVGKSSWRTESRRLGTPCSSIRGSPPCRASGVIGEHDAGTRPTLIPHVRPEFPLIDSLWTYPTPLTGWLSPDPECRRVGLDTVRGCGERRTRTSVKSTQFSERRGVGEDYLALFGDTEGGRRPCSAAKAATSRRESRSSLARMLATWFIAVRWLMQRRSAISRSVSR